MTEFFLCSALLPSPPPAPQVLILAALPSQHPARKSPHQSQLPGRPNPGQRIMVSPGTDAWTSCGVLRARPSQVFPAACLPRKVTQQSPFVQTKKKLSPKNNKKFSSLTFQFYKWNFICVYRMSIFTPTQRTGRAVCYTLGMWVRYQVYELLSEDNDVWCLENMLALNYKQNKLN